MADTTDASSQLGFEQHVLIVGPMGVMTADTGEFPPRPPELFGRRNRVPVDRMTPSHPGQLGMAADAEFVDRF